MFAFLPLLNAKSISPRCQNQVHFPSPWPISVHPDYFHSNFSHYFKTVYMSLFSVSTPLGVSHLTDLCGLPRQSLCFVSLGTCNLVTGSAGYHTEGAGFSLNWFSHTGSCTGSRNPLSKDKWTVTVCCHCYCRKRGKPPHLTAEMLMNRNTLKQIDIPIPISQMRKRSLKSMELLKDQASLRSSEK